MHPRRPHGLRGFPLFFSFLACLAAFPSAGAQTQRQVIARYGAAGDFQAAVFVDGEGRVDDALVKAFAAALQDLTVTLYDDDRFDLKSGPGSFVFNYVGGRVARAGEGLLFLHFGLPPILGVGDTLDAVLYSPRTEPVGAPPRLTFTLVQHLPTTRARLTWHAALTLRIVPEQP